MLTATEPTTADVDALTISTKCVMVLRGAKMRQRELTTRDCDPVVSPMPAHPVKSARIVPRVLEVTNVVPAGSTVNGAGLLITDPCGFVTTHWNWVPLLLSVVAGVV